MTKPTVIITTQNDNEGTPQTGFFATNDESVTFEVNQEAAVSAEEAAASAAAALVSETNAAASAAAALVSETNAAGSATTAASAASDADTAKLAAEGAATTATAAAATATTDAATATTQASNAAASATSATTQASNAATSATNAAASATAAATSATNAATSATNAAASAALAAELASGAREYMGTHSAAGGTMPITTPTAGDEGKYWVISVTGTLPTVGAVNVGDELAINASLAYEVIPLSSVYVSKANNLSDLASAATARTNLGLGTAAVEAASAFQPAGSYAAASHNHDATYAALSHTHAAGDITSGTIAAARLPSASTGAAGIVQLSDSTASTSTSLAATANAVKTTYDYAGQAASTTVAGRVELATDAETQTGTDTARAVTPASLRACTATTTRQGVVELATTTEATTGTDTARAVTPAGLAAAIAAAGGDNLGTVTQVWSGTGTTGVAWSSLSENGPGLYLVKAAFGVQYTFQVFIRDAAASETVCGTTYPYGAASKFYSLSVIFNGGAGDQKFHVYLATYGTTSSSEATITNIYKVG